MKNLRLIQNLRLDERVKSQNIRLLDVFLIGPLMIWGGFMAQKRSTVPGILLMIFGVSTILYNAANWKRIRDQ